MQTAKDLDQVADEVQRITAIMEEMQNFSKEKDMGKAPLQLADIIRSCRRLYAPILQRNDIRLKVHCPEDLPLVYGNAGELTQVLFNLLQNAKTHTESGTITISAEVKSDFIQVSVTDTGTGVPAELMLHVFGRGVSGGDGSGIGLAICKEIIDAHGGTISIKNAMDTGTTVVFTVPLYHKRANADE